MQNLQGQLTQLGEISMSRIEESEKDLAILKGEIETKQQELAIRQGQEMELQKLRDLILRVKQAEITVNQLKTQEPVITTLEKIIREYEYCQLNFKSLFESAADVSQKILQFEKSIKDDEKMMAGIVPELSECKLSSAAARVEFEQRETYNRQAGELIKIAKLNELKESAGKLSENIRHSEKILKDTLDGIDKIKTLETELKENLRKWRQQYPDMSLISEIREWYAVKKQMDFARKDTDAEIKAAGDEIEDIFKSVAGLWQEECFKEIPASRDLVKTGELLEIEKNRLNGMKDSLGDEIDHLSLQARLEEYATDLEEGKPCPLCGSLSHPLPLDSKNVKEALLLIRNQRADFEKLIRNIEQNQKKVRETESIIQAKKDSLEKLKQKLIDQDARIRHHQDQFKWSVYMDESELLEALSLAERTKSRISEGEKQLETIHKQLEESNRLREANLSNIEAAKQQQTAISTEYKTLQQQIELLNAAEYLDRPANELKLKGRLF
jgi:exonuclease SbcC